jgi:prepilin-type N-terminal cleavage/methylation domain-containing protein
MRRSTQRTGRRRPGFSLIEVLVGLAVVSIAVIGLTQLFFLTVLNNYRADRIARATFLAQQQIEQIRGMTQGEISVLTSTSLEDRDTPIDINQDGVMDFRMITTLREANSVFEVIVRVFGAEKIDQGTAAELISDPEGNRVLIELGTLVTR